MSYGRLIYKPAEIARAKCCSSRFFFFIGANDLSRLVSRYENVLARWRPGNEQEAAAKSAAVRLGKGRKMIGGEREREDKGGNVLARKKGCGYVAYKERI